MTSFDSFKNLSFEKFKERAKNPQLSSIEKIGFPEAYRGHKEKLIFSDIEAKLKNLNRTSCRVLDIGCGCSELPRLLMASCLSKRHALTLIDSKEMLEALGPLPEGISSEAGYFPEDFRNWISQNQFDVILAYSIFHYVRAEGIQEKFVEACLQLLAPGGELLMGDLLNDSKKMRFLNSAEGLEFHRRNFGADTPLDLSKISREPGSMDDDSIRDLARWFQARGCSVEILSQAANLPFSNRREDLLVKKDLP